MDFTLIWFPLLKAVFTALLLYGVYYFFKKGNKLVGIWYVAILVAFWIFTPYRYDGTNSVDRSVATQEMRTQQYKEVREDKVIIKTSVPDFATRMAIENIRSLNANKEVQNDIIK